MTATVWKRSLAADDPAVEINLPVVSIRSRWPFLYWFRDRYYPWSFHLHLPFLRVLSVIGRKSTNRQCRDSHTPWSRDK